MNMIAEDVSQILEGELLNEDIESQSSDELEPMTEEEVANIIERAIDKAIDFRENELEENWIKAYTSYYKGDDSVRDCDGWSAAKSTDVADMVESLLSQILPAFDVKELCEFPPENPQDPNSVKQAKDETKYINYIFRDKNGGFMVLFDCFKEAFLQKNGIFKVDLFTKEEIEIRNDVVNIIMLNQIQQQAEILDAKEVAPQLYNIRYKITKQIPVVSIISIAPENFIINQDHNSLDLSEAMLTGDEYVVTRGDLIQEGYDVDDVLNLPLYQSDNNELALIKSNDHTEQTEYNRTINDKFSEQVKVCNVFIRLDYDRDGQVELIKAKISGTTLLAAEEAAIIPYSAVSPFPVPHRYIGLSIYDKIVHTENIKEDIVREAINNMRIANRPRPVIPRQGGINVNDVLKWKIGQPIRADRPENIQFPQISFFANNTLGMVEYFDKQRAERAGAALDMQTLQSAQVHQETAYGIERQVSPKEQLASLIARVMAETGVKKLFLLIHEMIRQNFNSTLSAGIGDEYIQVNPKMWRKRCEAIIKIGMTPGERIRKSGALNQHAQYQMALQDKGSVLVTDKNIYNTFIDLATIEELPFPERYYINPSSAEGQQLAQQKQQQMMMMQQEQEKQQQRMEQLQLALVQMQEETKRMKELIGDKQHQKDTMVDLTELELKYGQNVPGSSV